MLKNFEDLLNKVQDCISTIRAMIETNNRLREIIHENTSRSDLEVPKKLQELQQIVPDLTKWRIYDHCAVVTQLYSIYEGFIEDLIKSWIGELSEIYPNYSDLDEKIRNTHKIGVARILQNPQKISRFGGVSQIIRGLYLGESENLDGYELFPEAFILHDQNLRKDILIKLLSDAGISNAWDSITIYERIILENTESQLKELIDYRNEASHGYDIDIFLNPQELIKLCNFIENLCQAITNLINYYIVDSKLKQGQAQKIAKITEWFPKPQACVAKILETGSGTLSIGDRVILISQTKSYCQSATIQNIRINDEDKKEVVITNKIRELGIKFDIEARENLIIVVINPKSNMEQVQDLSTIES